MLVLLGTMQDQLRSEKSARSKAEAEVNLPRRRRIRKVISGSDILHETARLKKLSDKQRRSVGNAPVCGSVSTGSISVCGGSADL